MADTEPDNPPLAPSIASRCRHLRSNGMYLFDDAGNDEYSSSCCWCFETMKSFGPDDRMVGHRECRDSTRSCYERL